MAVTLTKTFYRIDMDVYTVDYQVRVVKIDGPSFEDNAISIAITDDLAADKTADFTSYSVPEGEKLDDSIAFQFTINEATFDPFENYNVELTFGGETASFTLWFCDSDIDNLSLIPFRHRLTSEVVNEPLRELKGGIKHAFCKISELEEAAATELEVYSTQATGSFDRTHLGVRLWSNDVNAVIYYELTDDGSIPATPASGSTLYVEQIDLDISPGTNATFKLKAVAVKGGSVSAVGSWQYALNDAPLTVAHDPAYGTYGEPQTITLTPSETADIRYTTNGTAPTPTAGTLYNDITKIFLEDGTYPLKYIAYTADGQTSPVYSGTYIISTAELVVVPSLINGSTYSEGATVPVTIHIYEGASDVTAACDSIKYTLDGTDPDGGTTLTTPFIIPTLDTSEATNSMRIKAVKGSKDVDTTFTYTKAGMVYPPSAWVYDFDPTNNSYLEEAPGTDTITPIKVNYRTSDGIIHSVSGSAIDSNITVDGISCYINMYGKVGSEAGVGDTLFTNAAGFELTKLADGNNQLLYTHTVIRKVSDDSIYIDSSPYGSGQALYHYVTSPTTNTTIDLGFELTEPAQTESTYCTADRTFAFTGDTYDDNVWVADVSDLAAFVVTYTVEKSVNGGTWTDIHGDIGSGDGVWEGTEADLVFAGTALSLTQFKIEVAIGGAVYPEGYANQSTFEQLFTIDKRSNVPVLFPGAATFYDNQVIDLQAKYDAPYADIYYAFTDPGHTAESDTDGWTAFPPVSGDPGYDASNPGKIVIVDTTTVYSSLTKNMDDTDYVCPDTNTATVSEAYVKGDASLDVFFAENSDGTSPYGTVTKVKAGTAKTVYLKVTGASDSTATKKYELHTDINDNTPYTCGGSEDDQPETTIACSGQAAILSGGESPANQAGSITPAAYATAKTIRICGAAEDSRAAGSKYLDLWYSGIREITGSANVYNIDGTDVTMRGGHFGSFLEAACNCYEWQTGAEDYKYLTIKGTGLKGTVEVATVYEPDGFYLAHSIRGWDSVHQTSMCMRLTPTAPKTSSESAHYTVTVPLDVDGNPTASTTFDIYVYGGEAYDELEYSADACGDFDIRYAPATPDPDHPFICIAGTEVSSITITTMELDNGYCNPLDSCDRTAFINIYGKGITSIDSPPTIAWSDLEGFPGTTPSSTYCHATPYGFDSSPADCTESETVPFSMMVLCDLDQGMHYATATLTFDVTLGISESATVSATIDMKNDCYEDI